MLQILLIMLSTATAATWNRDAVTRADSVTHCQGFFRTSIPARRLMNLHYLSQPRRMTFGGARENPVDFLKAILPERINLVADPNQPATSMSLWARKRVSVGQPFFTMTTHAGADVVSTVHLRRWPANASSASLKVRADQNGYTVKFSGRGNGREDRTVLTWEFSSSGYLRLIRVYDGEGNAGHVRWYRPVGVDHDRSRGMIVTPGTGIDGNSFMFQIEPAREEKEVVRPAGFEPATPAV